ncbi:MAG TPA: hypothetical protein VEF04_09530 [Blastocatellia bacterium]|nr:hypothetical protein [Blastocatellia bacterium]
MNAGFPFEIKDINTFDWHELHNKIVQIKVTMPNPECLEFEGTVSALDLETRTIYILKTWSVAPLKPSPLTDEERAMLDEEPSGKDE